MYLNRKVYSDLVMIGVAFVGKVEDLFLEHRGTLRPSFLEVVTDYRLDIQIGFGNVFVIAKKGSLIHGYN